MTWAVPSTEKHLLEKAYISHVYVIDIHSSEFRYFFSFDYVVERTVTKSEIFIGET